MTKNKNSELPLETTMNEFVYSFSEMLHDIASKFRTLTQKWNIIVYLRSNTKIKKTHL